jgi:hypothetical protein
MDQAHKKQQQVVVVFEVFRNCDNRWYRELSSDTLMIVTYRKYQVLDILQRLLLFLGFCGLG